MELTEYCRGCKCSSCTNQNAPECPHDYECWCEICTGKPIERVARYTRKSWECKGYERRQNGKAD